VLYLVLQLQIIFLHPAGSGRRRPLLDGAFATMASRWHAWSSAVRWLGRIFVFNVIFIAQTFVCAMKLSLFKVDVSSVQTRCQHVANRRSRRQHAAKMGKPSRDQDLLSRI